MAVRVKYIKKDSGSLEKDPYLAIRAFGWIQESTQKQGESTRELMYDWIVNKKGQAYILDKESNQVYLFGAISPSGKPYLRTAKNSSWTDDLLSVPQES